MAKLSSERRSCQVSEDGSLTEIALIMDINPMALLVPKVASPNAVVVRDCPLRDEAGRPRSRPAEFEGTADEIEKQGRVRVEEAARAAITLPKEHASPIWESVNAEYGP